MAKEESLWDVFLKTLLGAACIIIGILALFVLVVCLGAIVEVVFIAALVAAVITGVVHFQRKQEIEKPDESEEQPDDNSRDEG